jgi:hypothetical protein
MGGGYGLPTKSTVEGTEIRTILFNDLLGLALIKSGTQTLSHHRKRLPPQDVENQDAVIDESVDLAHEIYNRVFRKVPERMAKKS